MPEMGMTPTEKAREVRDAIPTGGLFADKSWRISPDCLPLGKDLSSQILELGPKLHVFNKACNLLYRKSVHGKEPEWIHQYIDAGKPPSMLATWRDEFFKNDLPCVIRPDLLLTEEGFIISELDSIPGGIGLTAWLQTAYHPESSPQMVNGFIEGLKSEISTPRSSPARAAIIVSQESADYRPEMRWLVDRANASTSDLRLEYCTPEDLEYREDGVFLNKLPLDLIYRFFELHDLNNIANADSLITAARDGMVRVTPPFKPQLEEKLWFALFWFPQLADFWRRELGDRYHKDLKKLIPFTWLLDPTPLPPHAVMADLQIQNWMQLTSFSQKQRELIIKISGYSDQAWGSRGVFLGSDMPADEWQKVLQKALDDFPKNPHILQRFAKTRVLEHSWYDFEKETLVPMKARVRLCPYYFVAKDKAHWSGTLATLCPVDKKLIHGMQDAIITLAEC